MTRTTIDFGIDLGTTNSSIAVYKDGEVEVFRNNEGFEYTPSAVWVNKHNHLVVGREAKEHLEDDQGNAFSEFKRLMGTQDKRIFARSGNSMTPEELSAEVLKSLKEDVRQRTGEEVTAAVITVPADFELPQCEATKRAAQIAGLTVSPLLQEPVAAALAYGFQSQSDKVFWLVYDFGNGTFDAAIIQIRDGAIEVVNHGGDSSLGTKNIDWAIVENLLVPSLIRQHPLPDFKRGNVKWRFAFAKLKWHAKEAKIAVSRRKSFDIDIDFTPADGFSETFHFEYTLQQAEVSSLTRPLIKKTVDVCKRTLTDKHLKTSDIEHVILVGEDTLAPFIREYLADGVEGLGIPLEAGVDPMTVVARGAAFFAGTQRMPSAAGQTFTEPPLTHSIGLALPNNEYLVMIGKGTPLPAHKRKVLHTTVNVRRGQTVELLHLPVFEGEDPRADHNRCIAILEIKLKQAKMDVPAGSNIEVSVVIDRSRMIWTKAYVPILDEEYEVVVNMENRTN